MDPDEHQQSPAKGRAVARSDDGGETWGALGYDAALISPVCQASIVSFGGATYFSNPASTSGRSHLTIRKSTDSAASWSGGALLVQQAGSAGYSCLVKGALRDHPHDGGILYEATDGTIKFSYVTADYKLRAEPSDIVSALKHIKMGH